MCDVCSEFSQLLVNCESRLTDDVSQYPTITQSELEIVLNYILSWPQRQCMCCYRDVKNFERFYLVVQSILCLSVCQLKQLKDELVEAAKTAPAPAPPQPPENAEDKQKPEEDSSPPVEEKNKEEKESPEVPDEPAPTADTQEEPKNAETPPSSTEDTELWSMQQKEKLMHIVSKVFLLNFPLYLACKHSALCRLDDLSAQEISNLSLYCDLHDTEIPAYLLRNVSFFCKLGGVCAMTSVFEHATQSTLPLSMAHAIVAAVGNLKLWLNFRAVSQLFMPLRAKILKYMCTLEDKDLRVPAVKSMADFMWGAAKEPLDVPLTFDGDGLALAFKYFNSSTLTMRLAGVAQINAHIASHNELCAGESATDAEVAGQQLATWLTNNNIIEHLFGPNLHVEVIKQSHMILKFLAVEGRVTPEHVELVWAAAQLKHCGRQVYDLLPGFIRALAPKPCAHLYSLLCALPPKEHTEQSLYLASALMRAMWSRGASGTLGGSPSALADDPPLRPPQPSCKPHHNSSSEASVSMDQTNSDDDPCEELSTSGEEAGPTPRKQSKHQRDLTAEQEWLREGEELTKKECPTLKSCQKRNKRAGSSGSASSGAEEMLRPRKKKFYKKRHKPGKPKHFPATQLKTADLAESVSEVEEESSGSDTAHCQLICDNVDARRLMELRLMESYKRRGAAGEEEEGSASSALSPHSHPHLADLDEDDSACEEELARLAAQAQCLTEYQSTGAASSKRVRGSPPAPACDVDDVCRPGNTLLWDLLQDGAIEQLGEGLALEAEKALCALLCFSTDKFIRIKFIEGCLDNLANHRSVAVSLRLLPKLFSSFQQLRGMDMHQVVMWAERERGMMRLFLEDLRHYMAQPRPVCDAPHYAHITELTVRLHFLTAIFSPLGSPQHFRLTVEQVEELWQCLVVRGSSECADCLYSWLLSHTKSPDQHALGLDALRFLYVEKMPTLDPETISIMGLSLYQQLCNLARMALGTGDSRDAAHPHTLAMDHLWKIALRANSTDVSMGAIQYLNSYYMGQQLQQEDDFVAKCMFHLSSAAERLITKKHNTVDGDVPSTSQMNEQDVKEEKVHDKQNIYEHMTEEAALQCIQRALLLLKTHLDTFKRRYAYHLRRWALADSGAWEGTCGGGSSVRVTLQPAGAGPRASLAMHHADLVAHLRAHVHVWWETQIQGEDNVTALSTDGPLRMITQGQELTIDYDERTLYDMGFKDNQLVFVSVGVGGRGAWAEWPSAQPAPARTRLPTLLLLDPTYFHHLFTLMQALGQMKEPGANGELITHTKAQLLSRRVWDILQAVPLNPTLLEAFQNPIESNLPELLDPTSPQKLMYYLHIIDKLSSSHAGVSIVRENTVSTLSPLISHEKSEEDKAAVQRWNELFIRKGGLRLLYDIMMSGVLQRNDDSEWRQDCLALLLQLLCRIGTLPLTDPAQTPKLHPSLLSLMSVEETTERLISILCEAATLKEPTTYKTGFWGRAQVVQHAMRMCVWWARGGGDAVALAWSLRRAAPRLLLDDADPAVRREAGSALYRLCAGGEVAVLAPLLQLLLEHLPRAADMRPHHHHHHHHHHDVVHHHVEEGKEPYGPACRDYFWLVCRLIDGLPEDFFKEGATSEDSGAPDLNELCEQIHTALEKREIIERRMEPCSPDDGLYGQLSLLTHLLKHPLRFKMSDQGTRTLEMVFGFLFDVPNPENRNLPKCKSQKSRAAAYDLLVELVRGAPDNYMVLHNKLMDHHKPGPQSTYPWDYWPAEESRSECGYVGLTNLGATCYMASCMQHLYMMPQARSALLQADPAASRHSATLHEMQRMFAYLMESERKAYNPRSFCKVYQMDHQPLNTGEQKDMAEFFIDLVSKLEEMTPELKKLVKTLFCGVLSNNVVSLDCPHVSRTLEEFYTVRCQVADMRNLHQSLDEVTVKDTLEGDNCYTCSQCAAKVRAEKRACFKKLPRILCFNTMRYTFNMLTMLKEKVNTHFSFPMRLDMSGYVEKHLMPAQYQEEKNKLLAEKKDGEDSPTAAEVEDNSEFEEHYEYELIGVTVHTGTADGGHYYSFIRDREHEHHDRWLLFNDAEVKAFDPALLASECFGGEMTSKTYDSVTDKFMDFSFEKTNSAYMLFYEWSPPRSQRGSECGQQEDPQPSTAEGASPSSSVERRSSDASPGVKLPPDLLKWIWDDNMQFLHDKNIFQHAYFTFMGQMCSSVPQSLMTLKPEVTEVAARLSTSFFIETFIHAKEKPTMVSWVELVTKQFNASAAASEWFLGHMADDTWWPMQVLIKCPNQMVRQMFQRLCMHVIQRLRSSHCALYLQGMEEGEDNSKLGEASCVTRFIRMLLSLMENGARSHLRHLTEYFSLLYEFSKMGEEEGKFMLRINAISSMVNFYLGQNATVTESPTEEAGGSGSGSTNAESGGDKLRPGALDKMVALVAGLVERSRDAAGHLALLEPDARALLHAKGFPFIYQQTRDCLNLQQTRSLIFALCRWNEPLAQKIVNMIFQAIAKHSESCGPFFKLLTLLVEGSGGGAGATGGLPCFTQLVLARLWDVADVCPHAALEWLALQVPRNKAAHAWALRTAERWLEAQLLGAGPARVRAAAALLLVALVPSQHFRAGYARARPPAPPHQPHAPHAPHANHAKLPDTAHHTLHQVYTMLLGKLKAARKYTDVAVHGTMKLTAYFGVMSYCVVSRVEKLMFGQYFNDLWELYHPAISEPSVAVHPNKQALLTFWHAVSVDCPENVQLAVANQRLTKHIAFNYILADHEDGEVVAYNRAMLPPYYALLRLCCRRSSSFARSLAQHQNIHWAFRNIAPHAHLYPGAADELLRLARILAARGGNGNGNNGSTSSGNGSGNGASSGSESADGREAAAFRRSTLSAYLQGLNGRTCWSTLISAFCTLVENEDDRLYVVYNGGLQMTFEALHSLHAVYIEGGGAGGSTGAVRAELTAALRWARALCRTLRTRRDNKEARALLLACKDWPECARRLLTMLNLHHRHNHLRDAALGVLREVVMIGGGAALGALVPLAAGAQCGARPRLAPPRAPPHDKHDKHNAHRLAASCRPYHKFIGQCTRLPMMLVPLAAGAQCGARPRLAPPRAPPHDKHDKHNAHRLAASCRPYHKFIGQCTRLPMMLVPLAAGAQCGARPRLAPPRAPPHDKHDKHNAHRLAASCRPYHKFIGQCTRLPMMLVPLAAGAQCGARPRLAPPRAPPHDKHDKHNAHRLAASCRPYHKFIGQCTRLPMMLVPLAAGAQCGARPRLAPPRAPPHDKHDKHNAHRLAASCRPYHKFIGQCTRLPMMLVPLAAGAQCGARPRLAPPRAPPHDKHDKHNAHRLAASCRPYHKFIGQCTRLPMMLVPLAAGAQCGARPRLAPPRAPPHDKHDKHNAHRLAASCRPYHKFIGQCTRLPMMLVPLAAGAQCGARPRLAPPRAPPHDKHDKHNAHRLAASCRPYHKFIGQCTRLPMMLVPLAAGAQCGARPRLAPPRAPPHDKHDKHNAHRLAASCRPYHKFIGQCTRLPMMLVPLAAGAQCGARPRLAPPRAPPHDKHDKHNAHRLAASCRPYHKFIGQCTRLPMMLVPLAAGAQCGARPRLAPPRAPPHDKHDKHNAHRLAASCRPYHKFIDTCCRVARSQRCMSEQLVLLSALCALEAVPLRFNYFAAFWRDVATSPADSKLEEMLLECSVATEYVDAVLLDERESLEDPVIYQFMQHYYPKLGGGGGSNGSDNADGTDSGSGAGSGAAEALLEELLSAAARAPLRALLAPARALALLHARAPPDTPRARDLLRLTRALRARLQQATEEESSEPESGCAGGPSNTATRGGSGSGSSGDDAASEAAEPESEPDEATPRGAALTHLAHALDALDALAGAAAAPPLPPQPPPEP